VSSCNLLAQQAAYGIADSSLYWSQATGKGWSFVWNVGQTPFGVLSNIHSLSFVQRDAAVRNMALSYLNNSITHATTLVKGYEWLMYDSHQHVKNLLRPDQVCLRGLHGGMLDARNGREGSRGYSPDGIKKHRMTPQLGIPVASLGHTKGVGCAIMAHDAPLDHSSRGPSSCVKSVVYACFRAGARSLVTHA